MGLHLYDLYVEDVDAVFAQAINAGVTLIKPVQDQFYGDRTGALKDRSDTSGFLRPTRKNCPPMR